MGAFTDDQQQVISSLWLACGIISIFGSLFIIVCFICFKELRNFAFRLVLFLSISDISASITKLFGDAGSMGPGACLFQAISMTFFELASILWVVLIAFTLHMAFLKERADFSGPKIGAKANYYHGAWVFACIMTLLPLITDSYGDSGAWCWIKDGQADLVWRIVTFYGELWLAWVYCFYVYTSVLLKIRRMNPSPDGSLSHRRVLMRIMYYPLVLVVCWSAASVNRLYEMISGDKSFEFTVLQVLLSGLFGFCNAVVYGMTPAVRLRVKHALCATGQSSSIGDSQAYHEEELDDKADESIAGTV